MKTAGWLHSDLQIDMYRQTSRSAVYRNGRGSFRTLTDEVSGTKIPIFIKKNHAIPRDPIYKHPVFICIPGQILPA